MWKLIFKQFKQDLKYPFGRPDTSYIDQLIPTDQERVAISNVLALCKERIWIGRGREKSGTRIDGFKDLMSNEQANLADQCVQFTELYIKRTNRHAKEEETNT